MRTTDDDPREVKWARSSTVLAARKQAEAGGKRGSGTSAEDSGKKIKSMLKNILKEGKI